ncbi:conjugative transposon protein TraM [Chitinophaga sp. MM2321]|uniref:conjugative transposon protein TraM n=1 Tax=Chitinophaga sp. MM2321 TaxID=3137178 RepID=UPI0032D58DBE
MKTSDPITTDKQRKFLVFLPLLVLPFLTLFFWTFAGSENVASTKQPAEKPRINTTLPDPNFQKKNPGDKMSFYAEANADSAKRNEEHRLDPYFNQIATGTDNEFGYSPTSVAGINRSVYGTQPLSDPNEARIYSKLGELNAVLNQPVSPDQSSIGGDLNRSSGVSSSDLDRLENMMNMMQDGNAKDDPEMQQINTMLERIMDIQHPERAQEKIKNEKDRKRGQVYAVTTKQNDNVVSLFEGPVKGRKLTAPGFYGLSLSEEADEYNTIAAVVHDNQTIVSGSIVKLRLVNDIYIQGELIPKDIFLFGEASISGERMNIEIKSIRYHNSIYPVNLSVYDLDGMYGIHIPGTISRDLAKESGSDMIQGLGMGSMDPGLAAQAASAGIELSKSLIRKKVKQVKVNLKTGYKLLLKDENQESNN